MRDWLVRFLEWFELRVSALKLRAARPHMVQLQVQKAIVLQYVCIVCGEFKTLRSRDDIDWVHYCKKLPKVRA